MQVIGNIGTPVEKHVSKNGREYFKFRLAENHNPRPKEGENPADRPQFEPTWFYVNAFIPEMAADMLSKGAFVSVTGRLEASSYINKEGQPATRLTILAGKVDLVVRKEREKEKVDASDV